MTQEHPINPPPALVQEWAKQMITPDDGNLALDLDWFATQAARWGADQKLEACCAWVDANFGQEFAQNLRLLHRPKPPSLKERALEVFNKLEHLFEGYGHDGPTIRRALESLPE